MKKFKIGGVPEHFNLPWRLAIEEGRLNDLDVNLHWSDMTGGTGLRKVLEVVGNTAKEIKDKNNGEEISWRYSLKLDQSKSWLSETDWNYECKNPIESYEVVVDYLSKLNLITPEQKENWESKLF